MINGLTYREFWFYSVLEDEDQVRLSVGWKGQEYFALLVAQPRWRERRNDALQILASIIGAGQEPGDYTGEVRSEMGETPQPEGLHGEDHVV